MTIRSQFAGLGHYAPSRIVKNDEIETALDLEPGWIERRTGIRQRRWVEEGQALSDIAIEAGNMALTNADVGRGTISLLVLATSTPDHLLPPTAPLVAHRLELSNAGGIDLAGACTGFLFALTFADAFVKTQGKPALVIAANILSRRINMKERASAVLFSDAAGAVVLTPTERPDAGLLAVDLRSDGSGYENILIPAGGSRRPFHKDLDEAETLMSLSDGRAVFSKATGLMTDCSKAAMSEAGCDIKAIDHWVPHQANTRIIEATRKKLSLSPEKTWSTVTEFANSSAATIPFTLSQCAEERSPKAGDTMLFSAAGAGLSGGAIVWRL